MNSRIYETKDLRPMLLGESAPFDDADFIFEFKYDGARALLYITGQSVTAIGRKGTDFTPSFPEFAGLYKSVTNPCILDGEIFGLTDGIPDFSVYQKRGMIQNPLKARLAAGQYPVKFAAFDILYLGERDLTLRPLLERKRILSKTVMPDENILITDFIDAFGLRLFEAASSARLEGIVAKRKSSIYMPGRRSKDWLKIKTMSHAKYRKATKRVDL